MCTIHWFWLFVVGFLVISVGAYQYVERTPRDEANGWRWVSQRVHHGRGGIDYYWIPPVHVKLACNLSFTSGFMAFVTFIAILIHKDGLLAVCHAF